MELIVKINDSSSAPEAYKDGDIVQSFSNDRILLCHAQMICHVNNFPLDATSGLRPNDGLLMKFMEKTHSHKFERVSSNSVRKTDLETGEQSITSSISDVQQFLARRLKNSRHKIFGSPDLEIWYGTEKDPDLDDIWNDIETHTDLLKVDHLSWPFTDIEKRNFLPLSVSGFRDNSVAEISSDTAVSRSDPVYSEEGSPNPIVIAKRQWQVPYWDLASSLSLNIDDVRDKSKTVDGRAARENRPHVDDINVDKVEVGIVTV